MYGQMHVVVFPSREEAMEYMNKFKDHGEYMVTLNQHAEGEWYVEVRHKSPR